GRGRRLTASPVKERALALGLPLAQPPSLRASAEPPSGERPDALIVIAYGPLLPQRWLDWPRMGCINLHASLLPRWRGAAPIQRALLAGDAETGISVMQMTSGLDTGPVHLMRALSIGPRETAGALHDRLAALAAEALLEALPGVLAGTSRPKPQDDALATLAPKIAKSEALLDWREPAAALERRVRAFHPWPVAETRLSDGRRLRVFEAVAVAASPSAPAGTIVAAGREGIDVGTGDGVLRLRRIQPPSGRVMDAEAYLAAHSLSGVEFVA
ncbi:MAG TPA: methionyl-tRNA formyltransferase, partial [Gammaproteobacteria bacterium]